MKRYLLGADGGGSKTAFVLADGEGTPLATCTRGRSNPGDIGYQATEDLLLEGFSTLCRENGVAAEEVASVFAGVAGLTSFDMNLRLREAMGKLFPKAVCDCSHDGMNVLYGAFPQGEDGAIVICGTGSSCFVQVKGTVYRIGGYGQFDLTGNGYEMGKAAFAHVFRTLDGRDAYGVLAAMMDECFPGGCHKNIFEINGYTKTQFASFAPKVFAAARENDPAALAILEQSFSYIGELIATASSLFEGKPYSVALAGGIFKDPLAMELTRKHVPSHAALFRLEKEPVLGAVAKAKHQLTGNGGATPLSAFLKNPY
ncbi:MAG: ROK family protein [Clostridia bacterium]|nr:ROK family protein [Clostridia bacterium]